MNRHLLILLAISGIIYSFTQIRRIEAEMPQVKDHYSAFPSAELVRPFLLGHEGALNDALWLHSIDVSLENGHIVSDEYPFLRNLIAFILDLEPKFEDVAIWGAAVLDISKGGGDRKAKAKDIIDISLKTWNHYLYHPTGWNHHKKIWVIPINIGFAYSIDLKDKESAAQYLEMASRFPDIPEYFKTWAASIYRQKVDKQKGVEVMEELLALEILNQKKNFIHDKETLRKLENRLKAHYRDTDYGTYAEERIAALKEQIQKSYELWKDKYVFLPFNFFVLLNSPSQDFDAGIYQSQFPILNKSFEGDQKL
ncbi:MAG: hypothetical protein R3A11_01830 [Bdellovibrionota bacterium]